MNFKHFICNNCENEELDDNFLLFSSKNPPFLPKTNKTDINIKSMLSSSDNNNSTNNLEIIEYPYDYHANESNIDNDPEMFTPPKKSNIANKKNKYDDFDNFLDKIKPPKLQNEGKKNNKHDDIDDFSDEIKPPKLHNEGKKNNKHDDFDDFLDKIKPPKLHNEGKKNNKENNNKDKKENKDIDKDQMNISIEIKDKNKNENIINNINNSNICDNNNSNNNIINNNGKNQSKNSSLLIDNEDNLEKIKVLLNNYYSNNERNNFNDKIVIEKKENNNNEAIIVKENKNGINENNNSSNIYNKSGKKINYPHPDTNNFLLKSIDNIKQSNIINKKPCLNLKYEKNDVKSNNKNNHIKNNKKLIIFDTSNKNKTDFGIYMNNQKNKNMNNNSNSKRLMLKIKLSNNKLKIKKKESLKKIKNNISNLIKENNEYLGLKTETDNKKQLINLTKDRSRYLCNSFFSDSLWFKMKFRKRNTFSNVTEIIRPKINNFLYKKATE